MKLSKRPSLEDLEKQGSKEGSEEELHSKFESYKKKNKYKLNFLSELEELYDYLVSGKLETKDKAIIIGTLLYFVNPLDVIPDITPFLGFTDDFALVVFVYKYILKKAKK